MYPLKKVSLLIVISLIKIKLKLTRVISRLHKEKIKVLDLLVD